MYRTGVYSYEPFARCHLQLAHEMNQVLRYLHLAAEISRLKEDGRTYFHGAVGIREDGVMVCASNGNPVYPTPEHHCEYRITRKLGVNGTIYLVRTLADGTWGDSTPCSYCHKRLKRRRVEMVFYSTGHGYTWTLYSPVNESKPPTGAV